MAIPSVCTITTPTNAQAIQVNPATSVATFTITGTTDATTPISVALTPSAGGSPLTTTSNGSGVWSVTATAVPINSYSAVATAGTAPDTLDSAARNFSVVAAQFPGNGSGNVQPIEITANWLAGNITAFSQAPTMTVDQAICQYRGSSLTNGGVIKALNNWAGITDPLLFVSQNVALNLIARTNGVAGTPNLDDATALWGIAQALFPNP